MGGFWAMTTVMIMTIGILWEKLKKLTSPDMKRS